MIARPEKSLVRGLARAGGRLLDPPVYHAALLCYFLAITALRLWLFPAGSADDSEQLFFAQSFELGYKPGQPPLYTWIVWGAEQIFGTSLTLVVALKLFFLWAVHVLAFELARRVTGSARWGAMAGLSVFGIYYLAWDSILNYSQTVLIAALAMAGVLALRTVLSRRSLTACAVFGLVVGIGIANKYNFGLFGIALTGAALLDPDGRRVLLGRGGLVALAAMIAVPLPHLIWLAGGAVEGTDLVRAVTQAETPEGLTAWQAFAAPRLAGLLDTLEAIVLIPLPFAVLWLAFFPRALTRIGPAAGAGVINDLRLIERSLLIFIGLVFVLVAATGLSEVRNHWFIVLAPLVAYAALRAAVVYGDPASPRTRGYATLMAGLAVAVAIGLAGRAISERASCDSCKMLIPYEQLAAALTSAGFENGTIFADDRTAPLAGDLRRFFPDARFESYYFEQHVPPANETPGTCVAIWLEGTRVTLPPRKMFKVLKQRFGVKVPKDQEVSQIRVAIADDNVQTYGYILLDDPAIQGRCR